MERHFSNLLKKCVIPKNSLWHQCHLGMMPNSTFVRWYTHHDGSKDDEQTIVNESQLQDPDGSITAINISHLQKIKRIEAGGLPIVHHHGYVSDLPSGHRFPMKKFHGVMKYLRRDHLISMKQVVEPKLAPESVLCCVHTQDYVTRFISGQITGKEQIKTGFEWSEGLVHRCRLETGGTLLTAELALHKGLACSTAGGTHHAFPDHGSGFCLLNDIAIAAQDLLNRKLVSKVMIIDLDVHQGDGTAYIFKDDDCVFTFSVHCGKIFPLVKQASDRDVELEEGTDDVGYMKSLQTLLPWLIDKVRPDLIIYDAGVDPHHSDDLGKLHLSDEGLYNRDSYVLDQALSRGIPVATVIGGGYSRNINQLALRHTIIHRAAMKIWQERGM